MTSDGLLASPNPSPLPQTTDETKRRLEDRGGLRLDKDRLEGPVHDLGMAPMVFMEEFNRFLPILHAISHPNSTSLQFISFSGKGMRLEIMHHLKFMLDITEEQIGSSQHISRLVDYCTLRQVSVKSARA